MGEKKRGSKKTSKRKGRPKKKASSSGKKLEIDSLVSQLGISDRRAVEGLMSGMFDSREGEGLSPVEKARDLMYKAWDERGPKRRVELARKALEISPDCADAYVLLAEEAAGSPEESVELYQLGVEAGERALGKQAFEDDVGYFWGILETRSYMRARAGLAQYLWGTGKRDEAVGHLRDMLRLNPGDNQGMRYVLLSYLMALKKYEQAEALVNDYEDDPSAEWAYSRALLAFVNHGDHEQSQKLLAEAAECNPHVPAFLLGKKKIPRKLPYYVSLGDESEAVSYAGPGIVNLV